MFNPTSAITNPMTGRDGDPFYHELSNTRTMHVRYKDDKQGVLEDDRDRTREPLADYWTGETKFEIVEGTPTRQLHSDTMPLTSSPAEVSESSGNTDDVRENISTNGCYRKAPGFGITHDYVFACSILVMYPTGLITIISQTRE